MNKFEKIRKNNELDSLENISKRIILSKDIVNKLYNLFIPSENPNNPRNKHVLEEKDFYTIPYLSHRLGLNETQTLNIFRQIPFCKITIHKYKIPIIYFTNFLDFKKLILMKYKYFLNIEKKKAEKSLSYNNIENKLLNLDVNKILSQIEKQNSELLEKLKNLDQDELEYFKLVIFNNPSGVFNLNRPGIIAGQLSKKLKNIHLNKNKFFNKCIALGLIEHIGGPKLKIKEELLAYFK